jgi:WD40 repeat protein
VRITTGKLRLTFGALVLLYAANLPPVCAEDKRALYTSAVRYDSRGVRLALGKQNGSITVYDTESKQTLWSTPPTNIRIYALYFRAADTQLVAVEYKGDIKVYDASSGRLLKNFKAVLHGRVGDRFEKIKSVGISPSGNVLAIAGDLFKVIALVDLDVAINQVRETELRLDALTVRPSTALIGNLYFAGEHEDTIAAVEFSADAKYIAATTELGYLVVWKFQPDDLTSRRLMREEIEPYLRKVGSTKDWLRALTGLSISEKRVLTVGHYSPKYGAMQLWDIEKGEMIQYEKNVDPSIVQRIVFNRSGQLAISTSDGSYRLWSINDNGFKLLCRVYTDQGQGLDFVHWNGVDFSPTRNVAALGYLSNVYLLDLTSLQIVQKFGDSDGQLRAFPPNRP